MLIFLMSRLNTFLNSVVNVNNVILYSIVKITSCSIINSIRYGITERQQQNRGSEKGIQFNLLLDIHVNFVNLYTTTIILRFTYFQNKVIRAKHFFQTMRFCGRMFGEHFWLKLHGFRNEVIRYGLRVPTLAHFVKVLTVSLFSKAGVSTYPYHSDLNRTDTAPPLMRVKRPST